MAIYKRHVIYLSDEEWKEIKAHARDADTTMSAYIRSRLVDEEAVRAVASVRLLAELADRRPETAQTQAGRDAILRKINRPAAERKGK
jgi:hypothetical protein